MTFEISKGKYLLDANTFIRPYRSFYKMERFPSYWKWLEKQRESGIVLPRVVYNELTKKGQDPLSQWVIANFQALIFDDYENNPQYVMNYRQVIQFIATSGYYKDPGVQNWMDLTKADPQLIAIAMTYGWQIVTFEQSAGHLDKRNPTSKEPKIPDVADHFGVKCVDLFNMEDSYQLVI